jgi:hypothetical protein
MPYGQDPTEAPQDIDPRQQTVNAWVTRGGVPRHVAEGIADSVNDESGFRPTLPGDSGTSVGLYQAHNERMASLKSAPNWQDPEIQHDWAMWQVHGGDEIATKHWDEIVNAGTREQAHQLWKK